MPETTRDDVESGLMGLTIVFARLNETTPERQMTAPISARLADERKLAGNLKSRAGVADAAHHISAATITPSATGRTFNSSPLCLRFCAARLSQNRNASVAQLMKRGASTTRTDHESTSRRSGVLISSRFAANLAVHASWWRASSSTAAVYANAPDPSLRSNTPGTPSADGRRFGRPVWGTVRTCSRGTN